MSEVTAADDVRVRSAGPAVDPSTRSDATDEGVTPALALDRVTKVYPGRVMALRATSLAVAPGERACLLGPNGAGKTTVVRLLQGALRPTAGRVTVGGVSSVTPAFLTARRDMGIVPQQPGMYDDLRLGEYLELVRRLYGRGDPAGVATRLGLVPYLDRPLAALSGGLQRRAVLAAALLPEPDILVLDEPTVGLDPVAAREVRALLAEAMAGRTVLLCTHNLAEAEALCESVIILRAGQVLLHERIETLRSRLGVRVRLRAAQGAARLAAALAASGQLGEQPPDDAEAVEIATPQPERDVPALLKLLLARGVDVFEAQVIRPTLEDLFFEAIEEPPANERSPKSEVRSPESEVRRPALSLPEGPKSGGLQASSLLPSEGTTAVEQARGPAGTVSAGERVRALMWKELRQLPRKRGAAISAVFFPLLLLLIMPVAQMLALSRVPPDLLTSGRLPARSSLPAVLALLNRDPAAGFRLLTLPLVVLLGGLVVPSVMASHTIVVERERRTLDLLVALPLTLADVLRAKLATTAMVAIAICLPLFLVDAAVALWLGLAGWADMPALLALLAAALLYSTTGALVISLAAGDFRTANNTAGALTGPLVLVALGLIFVLPPGSATWAMAALLLALAAVILFAALRWLTIERLLR